MNNCACTTTNSEEMLLVKATPSQAATCEPGTGSDTGDCAKQEPMWDIALNDFLVPSSASSTNMTVCNGSVYTAGMWLEFMNPLVKLKVSSVNGNIISLVNQCPDGDAVEGNPDPGQIVSTNSKFVVCDAPECPTEAENKALVEDALAVMTEVCVPALGTSSATAITYPVGRVESDPADLSVSKCMKRIYGFFFDAGRMVLTALGANVGAGDTNYRPLVKHKTTNRVYQRENYSEVSWLLANTRYLLSVTNSAETLTAGYIPDFFYEILEENTGLTDPLTWPQFTTSESVDYDLSSYPEISGLGPARDHYYAMVRIEIAGQRLGSDLITMEAKLNNRNVGKVMMATSADYLIQYNSITVPIKVLKSDHKLILELKANGTVRFYYKIVIDGIYK